LDHPDQLGRIKLLLKQTQLFQCHREERRRFLRFARNRLGDLVNSS